jgi:hypothetical protein
LRTDSAHNPWQYFEDDEEEKKSERDRKDDDFQREKGDAEATIDRVSPQRREKPNRADRRRASCLS